MSMSLTDSIFFFFQTLFFLFYSSVTIGAERFLVPLTLQSSDFEFLTLEVLRLIYSSDAFLGVC